MSNWNKTQTTALITLYEQHPILYNPKSEEYLDRVAKNYVLFNITPALKDSRQNITKDEVKSKIKTLRNQHIREKAAHANSKKSVSGADQICVPRLWCYEELKFLDNFVTSTPSISNIQQLNVDRPLNRADTAILNENAVTGNARKKMKPLDIQISRSLSVVEEMAEGMRERREKQTTPQYQLGKMVENHSPPEYHITPKNCYTSNFKYETHVASPDFQLPPLEQIPSYQQATSSYIVERSAAPKSFHIKHEKPKILNVSTIKPPSTQKM